MERDETSSDNYLSKVLQRPASEAGVNRAAFMKRWIEDESISEYSNLQLVTSHWKLVSYLDLHRATTETVSISTTIKDFSKLCGLLGGNTTPVNVKKKQHVSTRRQFCVSLLV
jgi:hypothetical protein